MIKIEYDKGKFKLKSEATITDIVGLFVSLLDLIEQDYMFKFGFEMAKDYRKERDAKDNSDNRGSFPRR